ncbi:hypothetical protein BTM277_13540 [Helicobacter pylori]
MTKTKNPIFKNKSFSNRAKNSVIKKLKNSNAFLKTSPKIGDKAVCNGCFMARRFNKPLKGCYLKRV